MSKTTEEFNRLEKEFDSLLAKAQLMMEYLNYCEELNESPKKHIIKTFQKENRKEVLLNYQLLLVDSLENFRKK